MVAPIVPYIDLQVKQSGIHTLRLNPLCILITPLPHTHTHRVILTVLVRVADWLNHGRQKKWGVYVYLPRIKNPRSSSPFSQPPPALHCSSSRRGKRENFQSSAWSSFFWSPRLSPLFQISPQSPGGGGEGVGAGPSEIHCRDTLQDAQCQSHR